jgi:hypothetical protein
MMGLAGGLPLSDFGLTRLLLRGLGSAPAAVLSVTDHGDGTGATATLSGGASGVAYTVLYRPWSGGVDATAWSPFGTRTGNGDVVANIPAGYYWFFALGVSGSTQTVTNIVAQRVTVGTESTELYDRIIDYAIARIQLANITGIGSRVARLKDIRADITPAFPCLVLSYFTMTEQPFGRDWAVDEVGYPVLCALLTTTLEDQDGQGQELQWRGQVADLFRSKRLPGVMEVQTCLIEPMPVAEPNYPLASGSGIDESLLMRSGQILRFIARRRRG